MMSSQANPYQPVLLSPIGDAAPSARAIRLALAAIFVAAVVAFGNSFNGDLIFSLINIISHGIPYMALVWIYQYRKRANKVNGGNRLLKFFQLKYIPLYILALMGLAYFEECIWDWCVWQEHANIFGQIYIPASLPALVKARTRPRHPHQSVMPAPRNPASVQSPQAGCSHKAIPPLLPSTSPRPRP